MHDPVLTAAAQRAAGAAELNDYPTPARADYVFACMKMNGDTRQALEKCFCSIDVIASILPYDRYVAAETFFSLSQVAGRFGTMFQSPEQARAATKRPQTRPRRRRGTLFGCPLGRRHGRCCNTRSLTGRTAGWEAFVAMD